MRKKLQNSKGYAESLEFLPALGLVVFKKSVDTTRGKLDPSSLDFFVHTHTIYGHQPNYITLLACVHG